MNPSSRNLDSPSDIKSSARALLKGRWTEAVLTAIIPTIFGILFYYNTRDGQSTSMIFEILQGLLITGMTFGFMNLARNQQYILRPFHEIASPFQREYFKNLLFIKLWKYLFISLWTLLFIIPGIVKSYSYSQAELLYKDYVDATGEQPDARMMIQESMRIMDGYKGALFLLDLSFLGWHILDAITSGVLGLWLTPYTTMSRVIFYESLTANRYATDNFQTNNMDTIQPNGQDEIGKEPDDFRDFDDF